MEKLTFPNQHISITDSQLEIRTGFDPIGLISIPLVLPILWRTYSVQPLSIYLIIPYIFYIIYIVGRYQLTIIDLEAKTFSNNKYFYPRIAVKNLNRNFKTINFRIDELGEFDYQTVIYSHYLIFNVDGSTFRTINLMRKSNIAKLRNFMRTRTNIEEN